MSHSLLRWLFYAGLALAPIFVLAQAAAPEFDRAAAAERYRAWEARFEQDLRKYAEESADNKAMTDKDIERIFAASVVPDSRAITNIRALFGDNKPAYTVSGEIVFSGGQTLLLKLLRQSYPAGQGGIFPEAADSPFPAKLSVWYMHIQGGELLESNYFSSPRHFNPYHLPANGVLERDAYPFLMFEERGDSLRWGGIGREYWGALTTLWNVQFF